MRIHCPLCNTTAVDGQGLVLIDGAPLVQYCCKNCGELFFQPDRRNEALIQQQQK